MASDRAKKRTPGRSRRFYAVVVSIAAALATMGLKVAAYFLTGSVGLLSDAAESSANLVAAVGAFWALSAAARPPDEEHAYGHTKAEFFSGALEGAWCLRRLRSSRLRRSNACRTLNRWKASGRAWPSRSWPPP